MKCHHCASRIYVSGAGDLRCRKRYHPQPLATYTRLMLRAFGVKPG
jgi:hypothetical protein